MPASGNEEVCLKEKIILFVLTPLSGGSLSLPSTHNKCSLFWSALSTCLHCLSKEHACLCSPTYEAIANLLNKIICYNTISPSKLCMVSDFQIKVTNNKCLDVRRRERHSPHLLCPVAFWAVAMGRGKSFSRFPNHLSLLSKAL